MFIFGRLVCASSPDSKTDESKTQQIRVALDWVPNTNHVGIFVAQEKGFYKKQHLKVAIVQPSATNAIHLVAADKVEFAIGFAGDLAKARAQKMPVVSVAAIIQENTSCFAWRKSSGIKSVKDWEGKRYGGWGSPEEAEMLKYVMEKNGADFSKVKIVTTGISDFLPTTQKNADFMWIFMGWDGVRAKLEGVDIATYCQRDLGFPINQPSPLILTSENLIKKNPMLIRHFLTATSQGYEFAIKNSDLAADAFLKQVPEADAKLIKASLKYLAPEYAKGSSQWGLQSKKVLDGYFQWLKKHSRIENLEPVSHYFTNQFLPGQK